MKVSVFMRAYNLEPYIVQAIESVLMQQTNFDFEFVIGEDCSTDRTRQILLEYQARHPNKIRVLMSTTNLGAQRNLAHTLANCQGDYVAYLDGDDFWTDPHKLQLQADFLDNHAECAICFHSAKNIFEDGNSGAEINAPSEKKPIYDIEDLLRQPFIQHGTVMYRRGLVTDLPQWFYQMLVDDWCLLVMLAQHGKIGYIDSPMAVYRHHKGGMWNGKNYIRQLTGFLEAYENLNRFLDYRYENMIQTSAAVLLGILTSCLADEVATSETIETACQRAHSIVDPWADKFALPKNLRTQIRADLYTYLVFDRFRKHDLQTVRYSLPKAIYLSPQLLLNRGAVSIGIQAFLRRPITAWLKREKYPQKEPNMPTRV